MQKSFGKRKWDAQLDFIRVIAAILVVTVHVMANHINHNPAAYNADLMAGSGILIFLILSGWSNSLRYRYQRRGPHYFHLLPPAGLKLLLPYVFWTLFYAYLTVFFDADKFFQVKMLKKIGLQLLNGNAWFHLYFMVILIYLYLIYGLLWDWLKRFKWATIAVFTLSPLLITYLVNFPIKKGILNRFLFLSPLDWWGILFIAGILLAMHFDIKKWLKNPIAIPVTLIITGLACWGYFLGSAQFKRLDMYWWYVEMMYTRIVYAIGLTLLLYTVGYYLFKAAPFLKGLFHSLGKHAYTVYFVHPAVLYGLGKLQKAQDWPISHATNDLYWQLLLVVCVTWLLAYLLDGIVALFKKLFLL